MGHKICVSQKIILTPFLLFLLSFCEAGESKHSIHEILWVCFKFCLTIINVLSMESNKISCLLHIMSIDSTKNRCQICRSWTHTQDSTRKGILREFERKILSTVNVNATTWISYWPCTCVTYSFNSSLDLYSSD